MQGWVTLLPVFLYIRFLIGADGATSRVARFVTTITNSPATKYAPSLSAEVTVPAEVCTYLYFVFYFLFFVLVGWLFVGGLVVVLSHLMRCRFTPNFLVVRCSVLEKLSITV